MENDTFYVTQAYELDQFVRQEKTYSGAALLSGKKGHIFKNTRAVLVCKLIFVRYR